MISSFFSSVAFFRPGCFSKNISKGFGAWSCWSDFWEREKRRFAYFAFFRHYLLFVFLFMGIILWNKFGTQNSKADDFFFVKFIRRQVLFERFFAFT